MQTRLATLSAIAVVGIGAMYVDGMLLSRGVSTWPELLLLAAGGLIGLVATAFAAARIAGELFRRG